MNTKGLDLIANQSGLNRREFVRRATAFGLVAPFAVSLFAISANAATPKKGGRFIVGMGHGSTTDSLDPATHENGFSAYLTYTYANNLFEVDNTGKLVPELAESFTTSKDAKTWVIKLRRGVEFHNGKTLTADDVIASINHHRGEESKSSSISFLTPVTSIKKSGKYEVTFKLNAGNADFPFVLSSYSFPILPESNGKLDWQAGIGTGGYVIQQYEPGVRAILKRNPNYFKYGHAHFDEIEMLSITDTTARQNAILNDEVHAIGRVDPKTVHLLERAPGLRIIEATGTLHYNFPMRVDTPPFDNYDFRMALKLSVDRQQMVRKILGGHGTVGNDHPISSANPFHNIELEQRRFDPDKARFHLKKAGMENITVNLSTSEAAFSGADDACLLIKDAAAKSGININVVREPRDGYWSNVWNKRPWCASYWSGRPTEDWMFTAAYVTDSQWNDTAWTTGAAADRFNRLIVAARAELDQSKRREMYYECQALVNDDGGALVPMFANHIMALGNKVTHDYQIAANFELDGNKSAERWWFA
jgi:peptide/nickel transport system substrate-binding protein